MTDEACVNFVCFKRKNPSFSLQKSVKKIPLWRKTSILNCRWSSPGGTGRGPIFVKGANCCRSFFLWETEFRRQHTAQKETIIL